MRDYSAFSKTVAILIAIVIVILVVAGVAYYMTAPVTTPTPSPTVITTPTSPITAITATTPTQTMTIETQVTVTQTQTETTTTVTTPTISPIVNLRVGSYAKYLHKIYTSEGIHEVYTTFRVEGEEVYNNVNCLILSTTMETQEDNFIIKSIVTWWLSKLDLKMIHGKVQVYYNNVLVYERELSPLEATEEVGQPPEPINVNYFVGYETTTVPAGTFINCIKVEVSEEDHLIKVWAHQSVPIFGLVKSETYKAGSLEALMELVSYGG